MAAQLSRVEAQLLSLANEMDGVVTEVVRLQAGGPEGASDQVPELVNRLRRETEQLRTFEKQTAEL